MRSRDLHEIQLSIAIQHHSARDNDPIYLQLLEDLADANPEVFTDDKNPDPGENRTWLTYQQCLDGTPYECTHRLILQDDVEVCEHFLEGAKAAIVARPDRVIAFFNSNVPAVTAQVYFQACEGGSRWANIDTQYFVPAQALVWPQFMVDSLLRFAQANYRQNQPDDELMAQYMVSRGMTVLAAVPNLAEHTHHSAGSLTGNQGGVHRSSICFIGDYDPRKLDWSVGSY